MDFFAKPELPSMELSSPRPIFGQLAPHSTVQGRKHGNLKRRKLEIDMMVQMNLMQPGQPDLASPIVFSPRKGESLRFCVEYHNMNAVSVKGAYAVSWMDKCIDSLVEARIFSTLDGDTRYWQIEIYECHDDKTTCTSHHVRHRFIRMPFGLKNAPSLFQHAPDVFLSTVK